MARLLGYCKQVLFVQAGFQMELTWKLCAAVGSYLGQVPLAAGAMAWGAAPLPAHPSRGRTERLRGSLRSSLARGCHVKYCCRILTCLEEGNQHEALMKHASIFPSPSTPCK